MVSWRPVNSLTSTGAEPAQCIDDVLHQHFGCRSARGNADDLGVVEPVRLDFAAVGDQIAGRAGLFADLAQPLELELFFAPTTRITSTSLDSSRTAVCRF